MGYCGTAGTLIPFLYVSVVATCECEVSDVNHTIVTAESAEMYFIMGHRGAR